MIESEASGRKKQSVFPFMTQIMGAQNVININHYDPNTRTRVCFARASTINLGFQPF
ncbi:hypothetical protein HanIR_Chr14g0704561 [Helianthus annuus]|nr:hypothetical protein HanIR_Chr14g0704561 [Helianthus annuus]